MLSIESTQQKYIELWVSSSSLKGMLAYIVLYKKGKEYKEKEIDNEQGKKLIEVLGNNPPPFLMIGGEVVNTRNIEGIERKNTDEEILEKAKEQHKYSLYNEVLQLMRDQESKNNKEYREEERYRYLWEHHTTTDLQKYSIESLESTKESYIQEEIENAKK